MLQLFLFSFAELEFRGIPLISSPIYSVWGLRNEIFHHSKYRQHHIISVVENVKALVTEGCSSMYSQSCQVQHLAEIGVPALIEIDIILNFKIGCRWKLLHCELPHGLI